MLKCLHSHPKSEVNFWHAAKWAFSHQRDFPSEKDLLPSVWLTGSLDLWESRQVSKRSRKLKTKKSWAVRIIGRDWLDDYSFCEAAASIRHIQCILGLLSLTLHLPCNWRNWFSKRPGRGIILCIQLWTRGKDLCCIIYHVCIYWK